MGVIKLVRILGILGAGALVAISVVHASGSSMSSQTMLASRASESGRSTPSARVKSTKRSSSATVDFDRIDNRIFVDVRVNGKGPFKFIFDTGGRNSMTFELAKELGLAVSEAGEGGGAGNGMQKMGRTHVSRYDVGGVELREQDFLVFDFSGIQSAFGFDRLDGIVGLELLQRHAVLIDHERERLTFLAPGAKFSGKGYERIDFELLFDKPFIKTKINGVTARTLIDTGDRTALTVTRDFRGDARIGDAFAGAPEVPTGFGIGGPIPGQLARLDRLELAGGITLKNVMARGPTTEGGFNAMKELDASVGNEVLRQFDVALDYRRKALYLKKNRSFGRPTEFTPVPFPPSNY